MARHDRGHARPWWILLVPPALLAVALSVLSGPDDEALLSEDVHRPRRAAAARPDLLQLADAPLAARAAEATRESTSLRGRTSEPHTGSAHAPTRLRGCVLDADGRAIPQARVLLSRLPEDPHHEAERVAEVCTDAQGGFDFEDVPTARLGVQAQAATYGPAWASDVVAGTWIELRLSAAARLEVEVRDDTEALVAGARVRISRPGFEREGTTDASGRVDLDGLPTGPTHVQVHAPAGSAAPRIVSLASEAHARIVCTLAQRGDLCGRVVEHDAGRVVAGATVRAYGADGCALEDATGTTDGDGSFALRDVALPGADVTLRVTKEGYAEGRVTTLSQREEPPILHIALWPQRTVEGHVIDAGGRPVAAARLAWTDAGDGDAGAVSDARGRFRIPLPPAPTEEGVHALCATTRDGRYGAAAVRLASGREPVVLILRGHGVLSGRVLDPAGHARPSALVRLEASNAHLPGLTENADEAWARRSGLAPQAYTLHALSDEDGVYRLAHVPAGAWSLHLVHGALEEHRREPILLEEHADVTLDLTLGTVSGLFGSVIDADGSAIAGARVLARPIDGQTATSQGSTTTSAEDGRYALDALRADCLYDVVASAPGKAPSRLEGVVPGDRPLDLRLTEAAWIEGLLESDGTPFAEPVDLWLVLANTGRETGERAGGVPVPAPRRGLVRSQAASGQFALPLPHAGRWLVCARSADGTRTGVAVAFVGADGHGVNGLTLALERSPAP